MGQFPGNGPRSKQQYAQYLNYISLCLLPSLCFPVVWSATKTLFADLRNSVHLCWNQNVVLRGGEGAVRLCKSTCLSSTLETGNVSPSRSSGSGSP